MRRVTELLRRPAAKKDRKGTPSRAVPGHRRTRIAVGVLVVVSSVAGVSAWLAMSGRGSDIAANLKDSAIRQTAAMGLVIDDVLLVGRVHTPKRAVLRAVDVRRGEPILAVDPGRIARRVAAISWVESVVVERRLPNTLFVKIVERKPMALWQRKGRIALIDRGGAVLTRRDLSKFKGLVTVVGGDAPRHTPELLSMIADDPQLARRVRAAVRIGGRRWNLRFDNGIDVSLPQRGAAQAWARLGRLERKHGLLGHDIKAIDLRLPDRLIVRKKTDPASVAKQRGEKT
jgi:cell division protein FtsQ